MLSSLCIIVLVSIPTIAFVFSSSSHPSPTPAGQQPHTAPLGAWKSTKAKAKAPYAHVIHAEAFMPW